MKDYIQIQHPVTKAYVLVDSKNGRVIDHSEPHVPFREIPIITFPTKLKMKENTESLIIYDNPTFIKIPVLNATAEKYYRDRIEAIEADKYGNDREKVEFEQGYLWYTKEEDVYQGFILIRRDNINNIRPAWDNNFSIISHGIVEEFTENIVPMSTEELEMLIKPYLNIIDLT